ncbi:MAG: anti-sigma factor family protein [Acidimicrobiales bacterium]
MNGHEDRLVAFLAGDLDLEAAHRFDEHLLGCEACWRAVREDRFARRALEGLREPAPPGLADRVRMTIEVHVGDHRWARKRWGAAVGLVSGVVLALAGVSLWLLPGTPSDPAAVSTVVRFAELMPTPEGPTTPSGTPGPVALGAPLKLAPGGQEIQLAYYRMDGVEAVVATSTRMFSMPAGGQPVPGTHDMAWVAKRGSISLYCTNGPRSVLVAGAMPTVDLRGLATELHLS